MARRFLAAPTPRRIARRAPICANLPTRPQSSRGSQQQQHASSSSASSLPERPRVVILGTGWGGNKLARCLDSAVYDVRVISPANHFLFTSFCVCEIAISLRLYLNVIIQKAWCCALISL